MPDPPSMRSSANRSLTVIWGGRSSMAAAVIPRAWVRQEAPGALGKKARQPRQHDLVHGFGRPVAGAACWSWVAGAGCRAGGHRG
jgi:hypothetical protein